MTATQTDGTSEYSDSEPPIEIVGRAGVFTDLLEIIDTVVDECRIHVGDDGLRVTAVDPATVAMVDVELDADAFESYTADERTIGVDLTRLSNGLGLADSDQLVSASLRPETGRLRLTSGGFEYAIALLDPDLIREPPSIGELDLETGATVRTESGTISEAIRAAEMLSDHLELGVSDEEPAFYATAEGDTDEMHLSVPEDDLLELTPEPVRAMFSVEYLTAMNRGLPRDTDVRLRLGEDEPVDVRFEFANGAGTVRYVISPRIRTQ